MSASSKTLSVLDKFRNQTETEREENREQMWNTVINWMNENPKLRPVDESALAEKPGTAGQLSELYGAMMMEHDCNFCLDPSKCRHSHARLIVCAVSESGFMRYEVRAVVCERAGEQKNASRGDKAFEQSEIPINWRDKTFENFRAECRILRMAKGLAQSLLLSGRSLVLGGAMGCGKTHLSVAAGLAFLEAGKSVLYASVPRLLTNIKAETLNSSVSETLERAIGVDLLILDDMGTQKMSDFRDENLYTIVNERYSHERQIIISTNALGAGQIQMAISDNSAGERADVGVGERVYSRLCEMCEFVFLTGVQDYRKIRKAA